MAAKSPENPFLDQLAFAAIIVSALAFFVVRFLKKHAGGKSCDSGCGCGTAKVAKLGGSSVEVEIAAKDRRST